MLTESTSLSSHILNRFILKSNSTRSSRNICPDITLSCFWVNRGQPNSPRADRWEFESPSLIAQERESPAVPGVIPFLCECFQTAGDGSFLHMHNICFCLQTRQSSRNCSEVIVITCCRADLRFLGILLNFPFREFLNNLESHGKLWAILFCPQGTLGGKKNVTKSANKARFVRTQESPENYQRAFPKYY